MNKSTTSGFTLLDMMFAVAIAGILASIAYPSYQTQMQKSRRSDAMTALMQEASLQEKFAIQNGGVYSANLLGGNKSAKGYYNLAIDTANCNANPNVNPCFQITATATGAQAPDAKCAQLMLNNQGNITSKDKSGNNTTGSC